MQSNSYRPPVVAVLGHVDHGKTTLLDKIRNSNVASREAGGITQSIGASVIQVNNHDITFIDTPGHAAFTKMRSRGVTAADIAILVVAADDGVKPQTKEALQIIREANIPFIVNITKVDLPTANIESTLAQLEQEGVFFEKRGGDIPFLEISAKTGQNIKELLELITLIAEVHGLKGEATSPLQAIVIETEKDKAGVRATVIVKDGTLKVGQEITNKEVTAKVRGLFNEYAKSIKEVTPGYPAQILGFTDIPQVGSVVSIGKDVQAANSTRNHIFDETKPKIYVKAKTQGSLEALLQTMPVDFQIIASSVGDVNESDVMEAKSSNVLGIFTFESKASTQVAKLAEADGVKIYSFKIIYELLQKLEELTKKDVKETLGKAEIRGIFPFNDKKIAGIKVMAGRIVKSDKLTLVRNTNKLVELRVTSLKKQKEDVNELKAGDEGGLLLSPQFDFVIGDVLLSVEK